MNHGPDDQSPAGLDSDELALRRMLHQSVQEVEPRDGTLDYLRRAVPARRARKRQAMVGMAAAALFVGTAVPALLHVSNSTGEGANPSVAGHASQAQGGTGDGKGPDGGEVSAGGGSSDKAPGNDKDDKEEKEDEEKGTGAATGGATEGADPSSTIAAGAPACMSGQLGAAGSGTAAPDSTGVVYGSFRVTNVSVAECMVTSPGTVGALAQGAADPTKIGAQRHAAGDPATGLPDPATEAAQLALKPGATYDVKFAWVPSETCPSNGTGGGTGGSDPGPSPDPTPSQDPGATTGTSTGGDTGTTTQLTAEDGTADGSVTVTYTTETGDTVSATVSNACAGTVYWTGILPAS
ncbi:hypothetical protein H8R17_28125 [Streptomyces sp. TRM68367]|nr:hypothetical protein [Streptomyces sp. TRM68367]